MSLARRLVVLLPLCLLACSRGALPLPPIHQAPQEVAALRIFVVNASHEAAQEAKEQTATGYTIQMRQAVQRSLSRAGIAVVVSPSAPADLVAKIDVQSPSLYKPGTASMTLATPDGSVVEQISEIVVLDENVDIDERGPVALVERMANAPRLLAFARGNRRPTCERIDLPKPNVLEVPAAPNDEAR